MDQIVGRTAPYGSKKLVEVEHVKAHCSKKEKRDLSSFEKFVTQGDEKADELAKKEQCWTKVSMAVVRAETGSR